MENFQNKNNLPIIIFSGILSIIISKLSLGVYIFYPFNLFVTYLHESSHGLAAILTGGSLVRFSMEFDTSGVAYTAGGIRIIIISAGYLGSTIWGSLLLMAAFRKGFEKIVLNSLSIFFLFFTLLFARNLVSFSSGLFFALIMYSLTKIKYSPVLTMFLAFLAVQTCFQSFNDLITLFILSKQDILTDAHIFSQEITKGLIPPIFFAIVWIITSLAIFLLTLKLSLKTKKGL